MNTVSPQYYEGFRAAVGGGKSAVEAPVLGESTFETPEAVAPSATMLSEEERIKSELHPLDAFPRLSEGSKTNRPPGVDDQFRFRWFGLFYQGPQQDAFVLRLRLPGGRLQAYQLDGLAALTQELAGGCVVGNAQGGLDLPGVPVRDAVEALRRIEEIGLRSLRSGGDCVRAVRGGEHEALAPSSGPPVIYPLVRDLEQALAMERRLSDLPTGCEVILCGFDETPPTSDADDGTVIFQAVTASREGSTPDAGDLAFALTVPGFGSLDATFTAAQVVPTCLEFLGRWAGQGDRSSRPDANIAGFCATVGGSVLHDWLTRRTGPLATHVLGARATPEIMSPTPIGVPVPEGGVLSGMLERLAEVARQYGANEIRLAGGELFVPCASDPGAASEAVRSALRVR